MHFLEPKVTHLVLVIVELCAHSITKETSTSAPILFPLRRKNARKSSLPYDDLTKEDLFSQLESRSRSKSKSQRAREAGKAERERKRREVRGRVGNTRSILNP